MTNLTADAIAIDCPDPAGLAEFYAGLLGLEAEDDYVRSPNGGMHLWFQPVEDYLPPTWPTQERGQQLHLDFASSDHDATIARALSLGATLTEQVNGYHYPILLDPVGHPFCLVNADRHDDTVQLVTLNFDCDDVAQLAHFYQKLLGGNIEAFPEWSNLVRADAVVLSFQHANGYQPPTWPTQERGQQMHIDFHSDNRAAAVAEAISVGAELMEVNSRFTALLDPAGHPFCICDPD